MSEGIVMLGVMLCVCARHISHCGEGNALYPVLSSFVVVLLLFVCPAAQSL